MSACASELDPCLANEMGTDDYSHIQGAIHWFLLLLMLNQVLTAADTLSPTTVPQTSNPFNNKQDY